MVSRENEICQLGHQRVVGENEEYLKRGERERERTQLK